jgi:sugar phosphate isomerase/epimerase
VEFAGWYNNTATDLKQMLADNGLRLASAHIPLAHLEDNWEASADFNQTLGNQHLIVGGIPPERRKTIDDWRRWADFFSGLAEKAARRNLRVGYHNHEYEFELLEGRRPWDVFFDAVSRDVIMQFDIGNALRGGGLATEYLRRYPGRAVTVHVREYSATNPKPLIGEGDVPWPEVFELCETIGGTQWYIVEESYRPYPPLESVRRSLEALRRMGKV